MILKDRRYIYYALPFLTVMALAVVDYKAQAERPYHVNGQSATSSWNSSNNTSQYNRYNQRNRRALNGTWQIDSSRSDNVDSVVDRAIRRMPFDQAQRMGNLLRRRLRSPDTMAIEQQGRHFEISSSRGRQLSFDATGIARNETSVRGRPVRVNAALYRDQLVISSTGDRGNDYHVTFDAVNGGQYLRVTRRIYIEGLTQPVTVNSLYNKTSDVAQMNLYRGEMGSRDNYNGSYNRGYNNRPTGMRDTFVIPRGTRLVAALNQDLDTRNVREGERISMVVRSPREYENAVVEGTVTNVERSGRVTGRAEMSLDFDRIRLPNGETYPFAGYVESVRTPGGEDIRVDNEGSIRDEDSQGERTVTRTGIGAAVGALVGALAGGGKGAAIGAAIGAGTGAGSVFVQGREDLELRSGTEITIHAVRPRDTEARR